MITQLWKHYEDGDYQECLRLSAEMTVAGAGIDLLAAAGLSLIRLRRVEEGITMLKAAATYRPNAPNLYHCACRVAQDHDLGEELACFARMGLRDFPDDDLLRRYLAAGQLLTMDYAPAMAFYEAALEADAEDVHAHLNLAALHRSLSRFDAAEAHYAAVLRADPASAGAAIGRATIAMTLGRAEEARALLEPLRHSDADARFMLAFDALARGDYETGWRLHRDRWDALTGKTMTKPPRPFDSLAEIKGKRVAVMREGGHGDMIQFCRYFPLLAAEASEVLAYVAPAELRLLQANVPANVRLRWTTEPPDGYERTTGLFDLPYHFRTTVETIPPAPYLVVPEAVTRQRRLPAPNKRWRVGLCWAGGAQGKVNQRAYDSRRSMRLDQLAGLRALAGDIEFVSLQAGARGDEKGLLRATRVLEPEFDWLDTAAIVRQLDLVISVDTAIVHLAGALGCPTWLMSRSDPCWRWMLNRPDSAWYPGIVKVYGQEAYDDWAPTVERVARDLADWRRGQRS